MSRSSNNTSQSKIVPKLQIHDHFDCIRKRLISILKLASDVLFQRNDFWLQIRSLGQGNNFVPTTWFLLIKFCYFVQGLEMAYLFLKAEISYSCDAIGLMSKNGIATTTFMATPSGKWISSTSSSSGFLLRVNVPSSNILWSK